MWVEMEMNEEIPRLENKGLKYLQKGRFGFAEECFIRQLMLLKDAEEKEGQRYHKGAPFHNLGLSLIMQKKILKGLEKIIAALTEDVKTFGTEKYQDLPASRLLLEMGISYQDQILIVNRIVLNKIISGFSIIGLLRQEGSGIRFHDVFLPFQTEIPSSLKPLEMLSPSKEILGKTLKNLEGTKPEKRVFVGGSYKNIALLRCLSRIIKKYTHEPLLICDLPEEFLEIESHDGSMQILENCNIAIFDVSISNGYLMEIERCYGMTERGKKMDVLLVWQVTSAKEQSEEPTCTRMLLGSPFEQKYYERINDLDGIIGDFLKNKSTRSSSPSPGFSLSLPTTHSTMMVTLSSPNNLGSKTPDIQDYSSRSNQPP
jgi:hypothetical protein